MSLRCFVALSLPDTVLDALDQLQSELPIGTPMDSDTFHITLAFLDTQPIPVVNQLHELLDEIKVPPVPIKIHGVDVFGGKSPRLVWAGVDPNPPLLSLRDKIRRAALYAGIELSRQRFRPHITLSRMPGRLRGDEPIKLERFLIQNAGFQLPKFTADAFSLFRSTLHQSGAIHENLAEYSLIE